ncbi:hypothetical protein STENM327S_00553 [Streptomyces tendae]
MPRHASEVSSWTAWSRGTLRSLCSQERATTWARPPRPEASSIDSARERPVSSAMTSQIASAHSFVTLSTRSRTAGSLVRSDSKTRRKAPPSSST